MNSTTIAVDVAKAVFEVAVSEHPGQRCASGIGSRESGFVGIWANSPRRPSWWRRVGRRTTGAGRGATPRRPLPLRFVAAWQVQTLSASSCASNYNSVPT